jgi:hypothetical protein
MNLLRSRMASEIRESRSSKSGNLSASASESRQD